MGTEERINRIEDNVMQLTTGMAVIQTEMNTLIESQKITTQHVNSFIRFQTESTIKDSIVTDLQREAKINKRWLIGICVTVAFGLAGIYLKVN